MAAWSQVFSSALWQDSEPPSPEVWYSESGNVGKARRNISFGSFAEGTTQATVSGFGVRQSSAAVERPATHRKRQGTAALQNAVAPTLTDETVGWAWSLIIGHASVAKTALVPSARSITDSADREHHRHFHQHANHRRQRGARSRTEQRDGHGHGQFKEIARADERAGRRDVVRHFEPAHQQVGERRS